MMKEFKQYFSIAINAYEHTGNKLGLAQIYLNYGMIHYSIGLHVLTLFPRIWSSFANSINKEINYFNTVSMI